MVISEFRFLRAKGKIIVYYCNICGSRYLNMEEAEICEFSHKRSFTHKDNDVRARIKYLAVVRGAYREKNYELVVEARNIREAATKIREKFPHHSGYTLKPI